MTDPVFTPKIPVADVRPYNYDEQTPEISQRSMYMSATKVRAVDPIIINTLLQKSGDPFDQYWKQRPDSAFFRRDIQQLNIIMQQNKQPVPQKPVAPPDNPKILVTGLQT